MTSGELLLIKYQVHEINVIREIILFKYLQQIDQGFSTQSCQQSQNDDVEIEISN